MGAANTLRGLRIFLFQKERTRFRAGSSRGLGLFGGIISALGAQGVHSVGEAAHVDAEPTI